MNSTRLFTLCSTVALLAAAGCGDPTTLVGQPCQVDEHCGSESGLDLACDNDVPGGYCFVDSCSDVDADSCPPGSLCTPLCSPLCNPEEPIGAALACRQACDQVLDCREVITCKPDPECTSEDGKCGQKCDNAMTCAPVDPAAALDAEDVDRTCVFSGN